MATSNVSIAKTWVQLAANTDEAVLISTKYPYAVEYAATAAAAAPTVEGHALSNKEAITRSVLGAGYIWAKVATESPMVSATITMVVTK